MNDEQKLRVATIAAKQIAMNKGTLAALRRAGLKADAAVQLDFVFLAPDKRAADSLKSHLEQRDCLDVAVVKKGGLLSRRFLVEGRSHPTALSSDLLSDWVRWMAVQGVLHNCEFDGWGTEVPEA
jgi:hypothetical protein